MPTIADEYANIQLAALRKLHTLMLETDDPAEARRCATAILRAPIPKPAPDTSTKTNPPETTTASFPPPAPPPILNEHTLKQLHHAIATDNPELLAQLIEDGIFEMLTNSPTSPAPITESPPTSSCSTLPNLPIDV